jgi:predicted metalloprotease with PDZ domain
MRFRLSRLLLLTASLVAVAAYAQEQPKKCTASARECELQIREMLSGRAYLGVELEELSPGLVIKTVAPDSPAERAEFRPGDRLMVVNGKSTKEATIKDFKAVIGDTKEPRRLRILVQRHGILKLIEVRTEPLSKATIDRIVAQHLAQYHAIASTGRTAQQ